MESRSGSTQLVNRFSSKKDITLLDKLLTTINNLGLPEATRSGVVRFGWDALACGFFHDYFGNDIQK